MERDNLEAVWKETQNIEKMERENAVNIRKRSGQWMMIFEYSYDADDSFRSKRHVPQVAVVLAV